MKNSFKISKEQIIKINKSASRKLAIQEQLPTFTHKVHKDKKNDYNRQRYKKISFE